MRRTILIALLLTVCSGRLYARDTAVIVNKSNGTKSVSLADLVKMGKLTNKKWSDGKAITIVMKEPGSADMKTTVSKMFAISPEGLKALAAANKQSFVVVDSDATVVKLVETTPGALGLLDVYSITSNVNVLKVDGKMPLEPGYALHGQ